jgi:hypothetical protein
MNPDRNEVVERERRWMRPVGIVSLLAVAGILVGSIIRGAALEGDSLSEQLLNAADGDEDGRLLFSAILSCLGFALCSVPLTFLFIAARDRSPRVIRQFIGLAVVGGLLIGAGQLASNFAFVDAADDFAAAEAEREASPPDAGGEPAGGGNAKREQQGESGGGAEPAGGEARPDEGAETTVEATTTTGEDESDAEEDAEDEADERAEDARDDASGASLSRLVGSVGGLAFAIAFLYTSLWAMRVGLLTRFWGSLGMAAAVVSLLLPPFFIILLVWFFALGLLLTGLWFGGRPPAWEAGTAVPWPRPGEPPPDDDDGAVEGRGRELEGEKDAGEEPDAPDEPPRKRKRRR